MISIEELTHGDAIFVKTIKNKERHVFRALVMYCGLHGEVYLRSFDTQKDLDGYFMPKDLFKTADEAFQEE